jgi:hypothetical protein
VVILDINVLGVRVYIWSFHKFDHTNAVVENPTLNSR